MHENQEIAVLMGPTGTGKSALAISVAQARPTVIINADAMQMVADLRVLTARPDAREEAAAEHRLYGVLDAAEPTSVARWLELVRPEITRAWAQNKLPLLVGGTGMYIKALREGLAAIPPIPLEIRARVRSMDAAALHAKLGAVDAAGAAHLKPGDTQRLARALEVMEATGKPIRWWQSQQQAPLFPQARWRSGYLQMPRTTLYARLDARFLAMLERGALEEVRALLARGLPADLPILRAHGVPELAGLLRGEMDAPAAIARAQQNTRHYAKRQMTWLRHSAGDAQALDATNQPRDFFMKASHIEHGSFC